MLAQSDFHARLQELDPRQRLIYDAAMTAQFAAITILSMVLVGGLSAFLARWLVDPDLSQEALIGAVIMPGIMAFLLVGTSIRRFTTVGDSFGRTLQVSIRDGLKLGMIVGFLLVTGWHFLGQLAMARAIYGAFEYHAHPAYYCSPKAALYGLLFAVPVALGCALFTAAFRIGPYVTLSLVRRLPKHDLRNGLA
jgi:hypothetical protein